MFLPCELITTKYLVTSGENVRASRYLIVTLSLGQSTSPFAPTNNEMRKNRGRIKLYKPTFHSTSFLFYRHCHFSLQLSHQFGLQQGEHCSSIHTSLVNPLQGMRQSGCSGCTNPQIFGTSPFAPADFEASSTMCIRCFETQSSPGCTCTRSSKFLTHSLILIQYMFCKNCKFKVVMKIKTKKQLKKAEKVAEKVTGKSSKKIRTEKNTERNHFSSQLAECYDFSSL